MKKLLLGLVIGSMSAVSWSACTYNFDATSAQISAIPGNVTIAKFPTVINQKSSFQIASNESDPYNVKMYMAMSADFAPQLTSSVQNIIGNKNIGTSGEYVFEFLLNNFVSTLINNSAYFSIGYNFFLSDATTTLKTGVIDVSNSSNGISVNVTISDMDGANQIVHKYPVASLGSGFRVGMFVNQNSKQIGLNVNGINKGYISSFMGTPNKIGFITTGVTTSIPNNDPNIGQAISGELVTDSNQIGLNYSVGIKDICGNTI